MIQESVVDLRSDTVTQPTAAMRRAMAEAPVGDDAYGEDPTVNALERRTAELFERDAALFVPSGTMANQIAIKIFVLPGQDVICEEQAHIYQFELGMMAAFSGALARPVSAAWGILDWARIRPYIRAAAAGAGRTGLIELENTANLGGGTVYPQDVTDQICEGAREAGVPVFLDGARIFNAAVALGVSPVAITRKFDALMFSLSKGLGAPVGSMLLGSRHFIAEARQIRKMLGGAMRQAGGLAAAGLVALDEGPPRLYIDHEHARQLAAGLAEIPGLGIDLASVQTNIVMLDPTGSGLSAREFAERLATRRVLVKAIAENTVRMVTHCDVDHAGCERALRVAREVVGSVVPPLQQS